MKADLRGWDADLADWVVSRTPEGGRVLEVGCGAGLLGADLALRGLRWTGIDRDERAIAAALDRGLDAGTADFLTAELEPAAFDTVVFTRSLHHIADPAAAVDRARRLLEPGGTLLLDEFDPRHADPATAEWYFRHPYGPAGEGEAMARWDAEFSGHDGVLHPWGGIVDAVEQRFEGLHWVRGPYLWRMFLDQMSDERPNGRRTSLGRELYLEEAASIDRGSIRPVGVRLRARRPGSG